jgi:hypothetical protein
LVGGYVALALVVMFRQRALDYHPAYIPADQLAALARERQMMPWTNASGLRIGWQRASRTRPAQGAVMVLHGNGGTAVGREYIADPLQAALPLDVFILEYPGYADRPGEPTQESFLAAADQAFQQLTNRAPLYLGTESIGTGPGARLAGNIRNPWRACATWCPTTTSPPWPVGACPGCRWDCCCGTVIRPTNG